ncbi:MULTISPECIES: cytochrome P450 [Bacillus]|uniref:cytochrome P450 n=1 Tax=Bacillus TaxID=1386 RepID=UPI00091BB96A|nr:MULTISPECIES: cytochrome P450 [Bacillus]PEW28592.1 cytochrome P450 [Bacillus thuringiensis]PFB43796.1 cytochrome P450 [Bacillus thuringiensis]PFV40874.1 cytochrome P450 [Bacillus thuringiensis]SHM27147.1 Cytochrome P450 [Bacillus sp. bc15]
MSFLTEYNQIPSSAPADKVALVYKWLSIDWRTMYAELRKSRPIFSTPSFTMITRWSDVIQALNQPEVFTVEPYRPKIDPSVGPFMLSYDNTELNWHEKSIMRSLLRWDDFPIIRSLVEQIAKNSLHDTGEKMEVVSSLGRLVPLRIVQNYFGFIGPADSTMLRWSRATQHDMFRNPGNDSVVHADNVKAGLEMQNYVRSFINTKLTQTNSANDPVSRLCRMVKDDVGGISLERAVSNVCGLLVGTIETMSQAIVQALEQILLSSKLTNLAIQTSRAEMKDFEAIVWEALRFNPITTLVPRVCRQDITLAQGTSGEATIKAGTPTVICTGSAMFDEYAFPDPLNVRLNRERSRYLHFGFGHHECLGKHVGLIAIPEVLRQIFLEITPKLLSGEAGKIDFKGGPFPESFTILTGK